MKILIMGLIIAALFQVSLKLAEAGEPVEIKSWMSTGYLVKNKYVRCKKVWYGKDHVCDDTRSFLKYYKPCKGGWCRK